jgi:Tfp pilus assembly protein PilN
MWRYLLDLYKGSTYSFHLFWDGNFRALARIARTRKNKRILEIFPIGRDEGNLDSVEQILRDQGYSGEGVNIVLLGPATFQRIGKLDESVQDLSDWIIEHKSRLIPAGIDEDEMLWDYGTYEFKDSAFLCTSATRKEVIPDIKEDLKESNLRIVSFRPLLGFALDQFGIGRILDEAGEFPIQIPGVQNNVISTESGFVLRTIPEDVPAEDLSNKANILTASNDLTDASCSLFFQKSSPDFLTRMHSLAAKWFRPAVVSLLLTLVLTVLLNVFLILNESTQAEKLSELKFLQSNLASIEEQIDTLKGRHNLFERLTSLRSHMAPYINAVASTRPEKLWWRRLEFNSGKGLTIEGFCVREEEAAAYYQNLANTPYFGRLELSQIAKYRARDNSQIPEKFHSQLYRFRLDIGGI